MPDAALLLTPATTMATPVNRLRNVSAILALVLLTSAHGVAQTSPPPPETRPQSSGEKIRESLKSQGVDARKGNTLRIAPIRIPNTKAGERITFRALVRDTIIEPRTYRFSLDKAPNGATIDARTGVFDWLSTSPGTYTFAVIATDELTPERVAVEPVTIVVISPIEPFGYRFFDKARAAIQAKLAQLRNPVAIPITPPVEPAKPAIDANTTVAVATPTPPTGAPATGTTVDNQAITSGATTTQDQPQVDALKQVVGPFDMMNANVFVPNPDRYQLGQGDLLTLRYWSPTMEVKEQDLRVDSFGGVNLPTGGRRIILRGKTLAQAENILRQEMQMLVRSADLNLSLKELRTMSIVVMGEAFLPGNYSMPAVATLFNGLYMFGGPNDLGSLRTIELRRTDGSRRVFDLYRFLIFGDASQDVPLQPGDTIFIPPVRKRVTVQGEVMRPAIYELLAKETMRDAVEFAGGIKASGVAQRVSLETVDPGVGRKLMDVDVVAKQDAPVFDGDIVDVFSVRSLLTNLVTVEGAVDQPGQYALVEKMTVADLVERARGANREAYLARADLFRQNPDKTTQLIAVDLVKALARESEANPALQLNDRLVVYRFDDVQWMGDRQVRLRGALVNPGTFYRADGMRIADAILQAGGLDGNAFANQGFLQRVNRDGTFGDLLKLDLTKAVAGDPENNVVLNDRDILTVQTTQQASFIPEQTVRILGAVQNPGTFPRSANLTLNDLIALAGGLMPNVGDYIEVGRARVPSGTSPDRIAVSSLGSGGSIALRDGDLVTVSERRDFQMSVRTVIVMGEVAFPGPYSVSGKGETISGVISRAGGLTKNSFPEGTQFLRDPKKLQLPVQQDLQPRLLDVLKFVADDEYKRALAKAEIDKARFIAAAQQSQPTISLPGVGGSVESKPVEVPPIRGDLVTAARPLRNNEIDPVGNLDVNVVAALAKKGAKEDIALEDGDIIIIPPKPTTITVAGAVMVPAVILHERGRTVSYYLDRSGGTTIDAAIDRILVIRARGTVIKATKSTIVELGDIVFVPTKVMAVKLSDRETEIDSVSRRVTAAGVMFAILKALLG